IKIKVNLVAFGVITLFIEVKCNKDHENNNYAYFICPFSCLLLLLIFCCGASENCGGASKILNH
ncbi:MAG: hypothetical protein ACRCZO_07750, partial [Cetobacterium sp.]